MLEGYRAAGASTVVTASTGNHGAATAWAAARLGLEAIVFVPEHASATKLTRIEELGAEIRPAGADLDEAKELGLAEARRRGVPFFEDGAEPAQYDGYAMIGEEILAQLEEPPAAVVVPVGNGALLGGVARAVLAGSPETLRIGVVAAGAPVMADSFEAGRPVPGDSLDTFADGMAVRVAIPYAVQVLKEVAPNAARPERELAEAVGAFAEAEIRVKAAGAPASPRFHSSLRKCDMSTEQSCSSSRGATSTRTCMSKPKPASGLFGLDRFSKFEGILLGRGRRSDRRTSPLGRKALA